MSLYDDVDTTQTSDWKSGFSKLLPQPKLTKIQQQPKKFNVKSEKLLFFSIFLFFHFS